MSLLVDMAKDALDPAYSDVAARRAGTTSGGNAAVTGRRRVSLALTAVVVAVGLVTGIAAGQVRGKAGATTGLRQSLVDDVRRLTRETDQLASQASRLRRQVSVIRDVALGDDVRGRAMASQVKALELATGEIAVRGPGVVVTLDDAPDSSGATDSSGTPLQARGGQLGDGRIYDRDLQDVVNALWAVGAEAMSINGQRLTAQTAIRSAGEAVLVDFRPLSPPYVLRAVGDPAAMEPAFVDGPTARRFQTWTSLYGLGFAVSRSTDLRLPAAGTAQVRLARPGAPS